MSEKDSNLKQYYEQLRSRIAGEVDGEIIEKINNEIQSVQDRHDNLQFELQKSFKELKSVKKELQQSQQTQSELISTCAHDLKSPVGSILSYLEILDEDWKSMKSSEIRGIFKRMTRAGNHMLDLIDDLLEIGKIDQGKTHFQLEPVLLSDLCDEALNNIRGTMEQKEIAQELNVGKGELRVKLDLQKGMQIINNLLSNAVKFTPRGGVIQVNIEHKDKRVYMEIKDNGQGIPPEELEGIFGKFQTTSVRSTEGEKSTGLGLTIVKQLVDLHKGEINVKSKVGQGTSFTVSLPVVEHTQLLKLFSGKK
jgi:signal transduction histidine kinase